MDLAKGLKANIDLAEINGYMKALTDIQQEMLNELSNDSIISGEIMLGILRGLKEKTEKNFKELVNENI